MFRRLFAVVTASAVAVGTAGCKDGGSTDPAPLSEALTSAEASLMSEPLAAVLIQVVNEVMAHSFTSEVAAAMGGDELVVLQTVPLTINATTDCPAGGTARSEGSGSFTSTATHGQMSISFSLTLLDCAGLAATGQRFVFTGAPTITYNYTYALADGSLNLTMTQRGLIGWSTTGSRGGTCNLETSLVMTGTASAYSGQFTGTVCGHAISESF